MLMIQSRPKRVTPHGEKMLNILRNPEKVADEYEAEGANRGDKVIVPHRGWLSRHLIAYALGKNRLTGYDIAMLDLLVEEGLAEVKEIPGWSLLGYMYVYRTKTE